MLYKPQFCCSCGDKIERLDWGLLTSRRFCELCETEHKIYDLTPRILVGIGLLFGIFGLGLYWQKAGNSANISSHQIAGNNAQTAKNPANRRSLSAPDSDGNVRDAAVAENISANQLLTKSSPAVKQNLSAAPTKQIEAKPEAPRETIYFCGAQTKKGTPCSHRVKKGGRCWQHAGQPAMLPPEKLIAVQ